VRYTLTMPHLYNVPWIVMFSNPLLRFPGVLSR
jgi:hypothetical protein